MSSLSRLVDVLLLRLRAASCLLAAFAAAAGDAATPGTPPAFALLVHRLFRDLLLACDRRLVRSILLLHLLHLPQVELYARPDHRLAVHEEGLEHRLDRILYLLLHAPLQLVLLPGNGHRRNSCRRSCGGSCPEESMTTTFSAFSPSMLPATSWTMPLPAPSTASCPASA